MLISIFLLVFIPLASGEEYNSTITNWTCSFGFLNYEGHYLETLLNSFFSNCTTINFLYLKKNNITNIQDGAFRNLSNVTHIDLSSNNIRRLPTNIFSDTPNLQEVNFSMNNITFLQTKLFHNLLHLKKVNFQLNKINKINENCFVKVPSLEVINLGFNNLQSLQLNIIDNYSSIKDIILYGNLWNCDITKNLRFCDFMHKVVSYFWQTLIVPMCHSPKFLYGLSWKEFLELNIPLFHSNVKDDSLADPVIVECAICSNASLSWQFKHQIIPSFLLKLKLYTEPPGPGKNLTSKASRSSGEYYTRSKLIINDFSYNDIGNYTCYTGTQPMFLNSNAGYIYMNRTYNPFRANFPDFTPEKPNYNTPNIRTEYTPSYTYSSNSKAGFYTGGGVVLLIITISCRICRCIACLRSMEDDSDESAEERNRMA